MALADGVPDSEVCAVLVGAALGVEKELGVDSPLALELNEGTLDADACALAEAPTEALTLGLEEYVIKAD